MEIFESEAEKFPWLRARIDGMLSKGQVVIFGKSRQAAQALQQSFHDVQRDAAVLHGDLEQDERMRVIDAFRKQKQTRGGRGEGLSACLFIFSLI